MTWLGMRFIIDVYRTDKHNVYWIWKHSNDNGYVLEAVIPIVSGRPVFSAGQLIYRSMINRVRKLIVKESFL
jgi:hypothetical protein